jgi:hypothetical protein
MKAFERCGTLADVRFLPPGASSNSELPMDPETGAWERHENLCVTMLELGHLNL